MAKVRGPDEAATAGVAASGADTETSVAERNLAAMAELVSGDESVQHEVKLMDGKTVTLEIRKPYVNEVLPLVLESLRGGVPIGTALLELCVGPIQFPASAVTFEEYARLMTRVIDISHIRESKEGKELLKRTGIDEEQEGDGTGDPLPLASS